MKPAISKFYTWRYWVAVIITGLAFPARAGLQPILGERGWIVLFGLAVTVSAVNGGLGPGLLASGLSLLVAAVTIFERQGLLALAEPANVITLMLFGLAGVSISGLSEALDKTRRRVEAESRRSEEQNFQLKEEIAQRGKIEAALRESEERFKAFMDRSPAIAFIKDDNGRYIYVNRTWENIYGLDWRGKTDAELWPRDNANMFTESDRRALEAGQACESYETVLDKDGQPQDWWVMKFPIVDAAGKRSLGAMAMDITERKRSDEVLRNSEERLRLVLDTMPAAAYTCDADGLITYFNEHARELWGRRPKLNQREDRFCGSFQLYSSNGLAISHDQCWMAQALREKKALIGQEVVIERPGGDRRLVLAHATPLWDSSGSLIGAVNVLLDITERKHAEDALRAAHDELEQRVLERTAELNLSNALLQQKEEQLLLAQRAGHIGLWNRDLTTGADQISAEWRDLMGFPPNQPQVGYADFLARIHPDDRARMQARTSTLKDGDFEAEFRINHPEKGERWILSRGRRGISAEDGHLRMMGALIDVTARKRAEEKLTATKNLLQKVMDSSPDWIFAKDLDHRFLFVNRAFAEAQSLTPDDMIGKLDTEFWPEEFCQGNPDKGIRGFHEDDRAAFQGVTVHNPADPATVSDGSVHNFDTFKSPMRDEAGRIFGVLCYCRDTTARKQAEEALRESEARLRSILDHHSAPVFIKDVSGRYVHVNRRFEELFGLDDAKSLGKTDAELFASEQAEAFQRNDQKVLDLGHAIQFEEVAQYYDGKHTSIVDKFPLRDGQGKVYALCGIATDITERKRAEEALRKLTDDLDRRVVERTRELAESQARLRALVAQLSRAEERERRRLAVELHDYLAQMLTISRLKIGRANRLATDDALKKRLAEAQESVDDSIAYTRTLMAQLSPRVLYDLGLPAALAWLAAQQKDRHGLDVDLSGKAEEFALDEERSVLAYQCVRELLWNIVKHAETNQATVSYALEHGELTVEVADDGRGFDPESLSANGNGVEKFGLFSIRERLELFGGKIEVTSQTGRGTKARFTMPAPQTDMAPVVTQDAVPLSAALGIGTRLSVALVDDHEVVRRGLRQLLEEFADLMVVGEAKDGLEGIELARQFRPDVVVMDINMPGMNGIEATKLIIQEMPSTIVVGLSFESGTQVTQAMKAAGAFTCVTKERAAEDIHQAIMDAVEGRRMAAHWVGIAPVP